MRVLGAASGVPGLGVALVDSGFQLVQSFVPVTSMRIDPLGDLVEGLTTDRDPPLTLGSRATRPARSSTLRCWETAGPVISSGSAIVPTVAEPL